MPNGEDAEARAEGRKAGTGPDEAAEILPEREWERGAGKDSGKHTGWCGLQESISDIKCARDVATVAPNWTRDDDQQTAKKMKRKPFLRQPSATLSFFDAKNDHTIGRK